jgi:hypothetical protein
MTERQEITFENVKAAKKPGDSRLTQEQWKTNMSLVQVLFEVGKPQNIVEDSVCGPNFPNKYSVDRSTVEFMPHWGYYIVDKGTRKQFPLPSQDMPQEEIARDIISYCSS